MFDELLLREKGAKRAVLEYIASEDSSIAIPKTVAEDNILDGVIVRSDHWREFDSFEGIFESVAVGKKFYDNRMQVVAQLTNSEQILNYMNFKETGIEAVDKEMQFLKNNFERYCNSKGLVPVEVMSEFMVFPQQKINSRVLGTIFFHPNIPGRYMTYVSGKGDKGNYQAAFFMDKVDNELTNITGENVIGRIPLEMLLTVSPINVNDMNQIVQCYDKVHSLPKFQDGFVYMMEFTYDPTYVLQMRRFRLIEDGSSLECSWKDKEGVLKTDLTFGITKSSEGIVLPYLNATMLFGIPQRVEWANGEFFDLAERHSKGFAYRGSDDYHTKVILPNAHATLGDYFCHSFNHGVLSNMAHMPLYFSGMKHQVDKTNIQSENLVRLFSKGSEGYMRIESR